MKFKMTVNGHNILVDANQLDILMDVFADAEFLTETHVGNNQGTQGYQNAYVPAIKSVITHELFTVAPISEDYIDTIKLTMKINDNATIRMTT